MSKKRVAPIAQIKGSTEHELSKHVTPAKTASYTPVSHKLIIETIKSEVEKRGLKILKADYRTGFGGDRVIGMYQLIDPSEKPEKGVDRLVRTIAFRNSTDKSMSFGVGGGATVFICSNGMFSADMTFVKKHVGDLDEIVVEKIVWVMDGLEVEFERLKELRKRLKEKRISKRIQAELVGRLIIQEELLTATQISVLRDQRENSKYFKGNSAWALYNNVTEALKTTKPTHYHKQHQQVTRFFDKEFKVRKPRGKRVVQVVA
jgi:hypothetical protein